MAGFLDLFRKYKNNAAMAKLDREIAAIGAEKSESWLGGALRSRIARVGGNLVGDTKNTLLVAPRMAGSTMKYGAIGALALGGLAYVASSGRNKVTPADVADDNLSPQDIGAITPTVPESPVLEPMQNPATLMGQAPVNGEWVGRVRGNGPEKFNDMPVPDVARAEKFAQVSSGKESDGLSMGA